MSGKALDKDRRSIDKRIDRMLDKALRSKYPNKKKGNGGKNGKRK